MGHVGLSYLMKRMGYQCQYNDKSSWHVVLNVEGVIPGHAGTSYLMYKRCCKCPYDDGVHRDKISDVYGVTVRSTLWWTCTE